MRRALFLFGQRLFCPPETISGEEDAEKKRKNKRVSYRHVRHPVRTLTAHFFCRAASFAVFLAGLCVGKGRAVLLARIAGALAARGRARGCSLQTVHGVYDKGRVAYKEKPKLWFSGVQVVVT